MVGDESWLKETFIPAVQQRIAAIQSARFVLRWIGCECDRGHGPLTHHGHAESDWNSVAVCSDGSYGVEEGLICSFPVRTRSGKWEIAQGVSLNEFGRAKTDASVAELKEEKALGE